MVKLQVPETDSVDEIIATVTQHRWEVPVEKVKELLTAAAKMAADSKYTVIPEFRRKWEGLKQVLRIERVDDPTSLTDVRQLMKATQAVIDRFCAWFERWIGSMVPSRAGIM